MNVTKHNCLVVIAAAFILLASSFSVWGNSYYLEEYDSDIRIDHSAGLTSYYAKYNAWTEANTSVPRVYVAYSVFKNDIVQAVVENTEYNTCCTDDPRQTTASSLSSARWEIIAEHVIRNGCCDSIDSGFSSDSLYYSSS